MLKISLKEIIEATGGRIIGPDGAAGKACGDAENDKAYRDTGTGKASGTCGDIVITGISTDSRKIEAGDLFIPLIGENFDGHDYIAGAFEKGATVALSQKPILDFPGKVVVTVDNTLKALQDLAALYRSRFSIPFTGITGSVGKTSTKEMVACALGTRYNVLKNEGNLNNEIGVPLTVFRLDESHEAAVVEMGMSGFGEINALTAIVRPKVGIITNIGISHIEKLGSRQNILKAKLEILEGLQPDGLLILNGDDPLLSGVKGLLKVRTVSYGMNEGVDYQAVNVCSRGINGIDFDIRIRTGEYKVHVPAPGVHNVYNALAAIAAGLELSVPMEDIIGGIAQFKAGKMRMDIICGNGLTVINDAYNASPQSVKAALEVLGEMDSTRRIAVLGDMLELGEWSEQAHTQTGADAAAIRLDYLVTVGKNAAHIAEGATAAGFPADHTVSFSSNSDALEFLSGMLKPGDTVLVKGSRGMKMEEIVQELVTE
ncbi:MAG TPA: UDP-N-acetylmuramoyl-tripeptide--D-alanyl-D-alanine ligase [Clostridia bacterium]|nr:UDP-N-acetylmuramoyl-tripeptide--D-alanyl-D-alanine ligase [Clostridia bacterium]